MTREQEARYQAFKAWTLYDEAPAAAVEYITRRARERAWWDHVWAGMAIGVMFGVLVLRVVLG